jgi:hypothetical protein
MAIVLLFFSPFLFFHLSNSLRPFYNHSSQRVHQSIVCSFSGRHRRRTVEKCYLSRPSCSFCIHTSWREWRSTSRICHLFFFSFGIGHPSYNVSFFYFTCTHINIKWWSVYFCFVLCNLNGILFSAMMCFFSSTVYLCLFLLLYLSSLMYSTWKAYISSTYDTSLKTLISLVFWLLKGKINSFSSHKYTKYTYSIEEKNEKKTTNERRSLPVILPKRRSTFINFYM